MEQTHHLRSPLATMTVLTGLLASIAAAAPARACEAARTNSSMAGLPEAWRAAVDELVRSTAEPGHPWSCSGGKIELAVIAKGALLRVAREGEEGAWRPVAVPEDVLPLGQAMLATPLAPSDVAEHAVAAAPGDQGNPNPQLEVSRVVPDAASPPAAVAAPAALATSSPRLLLGGGVDARHVGGSDVAWIGPTLSAGVRMGRWLPSISFRQQSDVSTGRGPSIDELSVALAVQSRFEISTFFELRTGLLLRGAAVQRDLHKHGEQSSIEGRIGAVVSGVLPVFRWANVVLSADGEFTAVSRESVDPEPQEQQPTTFPTYTLGGSACLEVPL
jgi:hypothetical protein